MLSGYNIVYFGTEQWDGLLRPRQQLLSVFARQNKVLFVDGRVHLPQVVARFRQGNAKLADLRRPPLRQVAENLHVLTYPLWTPISGRYPLGQLFQQARRFILHRAMRQLKMSEPIVWFLRPSMLDLFDDVSSARMFVYHCEDEYSAYQTVTPDQRQRIIAQEKKMLARVDAVFVVSKKLYEAKKPFNEQTYLVSNGVNYRAYAAALADARLPDDIAAINRPRLGYSGNINDKLNFEMLKALMEAHPDWSLIFLGQLNVTAKKAGLWQALQALPNVYHIGPVAWSQVAHYVKAFDVGLMPYEQNEHAQNISPMKLYDYMAAGLPIASLDFPAARDFRQYLHLADTPAAFSEAVCAALADTTPPRRQERIEMAARNSWEARAEQMSSAIEAHLAARSIYKNKLLQGNF